MEGNCSSALMQPARNRCLSHARVEHFSDALSQFGLGKVVERVGHSKIVSHRLAGETCGAECPSTFRIHPHKVSIPFLSEHVENALRNCIRLPDVLRPYPAKPEDK